MGKTESWSRPSVGLIIAYVGILLSVLLYFHLNDRQNENSSLARCEVAVENRNVIRRVIVEATNDADNPEVRREFLSLAPRIVCRIGDDGLWFPEG